MIRLGGRILATTVQGLDRDRIVRVTRNPNRPGSLRRGELFVVDTEKIPNDFWGYLTFEGCHHASADANDRWFYVDRELAYLAEGDVVRISSDVRRVRVMFRSSPTAQNSLLLTERCNHYCLMCSQPPRTQDDSHLVEDIRDVLRLASRDCKELGFTGGEPTLLGDDFLELVRLANSYLPETSLHVLTNGRAFEQRDFAKRLGQVNHHDLMLGVPIYSDVPEIHNYVVQAKNALEGTIRGIINLIRYGVPVEIRIVLHKITKSRLINLAEFIATNLPFVSHVAFMGLEMTGFARANKELLWIEPDAYADELRDSVLFLAKRRIRVSIYNLQHCLMPRDIWPYMRRSISDWKNEYEPECETCSVRNACGGFFSSFIHQKPKNIKAIQHQ